MTASYSFRWTDEKAIEVLSNIKSRKELHEHGGLLQYIKKRNLINIDEKYPKHQALTEKEIQKIAEKYLYLKDFKKEEPSAYRRAQQKKWLKKFTWLKRGGDKWKSNEEVIEASKKYKTKKDLLENEPGIYYYAKRKKLLKDMVWLQNAKHNRKMNDEEVIEISKKYTTLKEFKEKEYQAYKYANRYKLLTKMVWLKRNKK